MGDGDKSSKTGTDAASGSSGEPSSTGGEGHRRGVLKKLLAGGGLAIGAESLPHAWKKPIVETVVLPVHAQTTTGNEFGGPIGIGSASVLDGLITPTYAANNFVGGCVFLRIIGDTVESTIQMAGGLFYSPVGKIINSAFSMFFGQGDTIIGELIRQGAAIVRIEGDVNGAPFTATPDGAGSCPKDTPDGPSPTTTVAPTTTVSSSTSSSTPSPSTSPA